ncbi:hypothetical protein COLO4_22802 [Corchorus olitorius]|uniref:Uncharacterized protein n=1 Tax=Corchorus olitorius TaxID=93759 RepID=A0A1R3IJS3_9ROSI|nr:hypothetical protein COLO4_22802 [Corchorus olitorius]
MATEIPKDSDVTSQEESTQASVAAPSTATKDPSPPKSGKPRELDVTIETRPPITLPVNLNPANYQIAISKTLNDVLLHLKGHVKDAEIITHHATTLTKGIMIMTYLRLRSLNLSDITLGRRFFKRPQVPSPFEVPQPYALAISHLGRVRTSGLPNQMLLTPSLPEDLSPTFGLAENEVWSPYAYARSVEYAKSIGMRFATVDLSVKLGSTWWLYRPVLEEGLFSLQCPIPGENFTNATAILASLFCVDANGGFLNPVFDTGILGADSYGTMLRLRHPRERIDLSTYWAFDDS